MSMWVVHVVQVLRQVQIMMRGVGVVCEMCVCLARGGMGGELGKWMR